MDKRPVGGTGHNVELRIEQHLPVCDQVLDLLLHYKQHENEKALHRIGQIRDIKELRPSLVAAHEVRDKLREPGDAHYEKEA